MEFLTKHSTVTNPVLRITVLMLLVVLPITGFLLGMQYQSMVSIPRTDSQLIVQPAESLPQNDVKNNTIGWKTYENSKYGFSFKYPLEYRLNDVTGAGGDIANVPWKITLNNSTSTVSSSIQRRGCVDGIGKEIVNIDNREGVRSLEKGEMNGFIFSTDRVEVSMDKNLCFILEKYTDNKGAPEKQENTSQIYENLGNQDKGTLDTIISTIKFSESENDSQIDQNIEWKTFIHNKFQDRSDWKSPWKGFALSYPSNWKIESKRAEDDPSGIGPHMNVTITAGNGDYLEIIQGVGGGGYCLFPDQAEYNTFDGNATKYSTYKEMLKSTEVIWRLADWPTKDPFWTHQLCERFHSDMFKNGFKDSTIIGFTKIKVTTKDSIQKLNEILERIKILD